MHLFKLNFGVNYSVILSVKSIPGHLAFLWLCAIITMPDYGVVVLKVLVHKADDNVSSTKSLP